MTRKINKILHVLFWMLIPFELAFIIWAYQFTHFNLLGKSIEKSYWTILSDSAALATAIVLTGAGTFYFVDGVILPNLWKAGKHKKAVKLLTLSLLLFPYLIIIILSVFSFAVAWSFYYFLLTSYCAMLGFSILAALYGSLKRSIRMKREISQLETRNIQAELQLLRSQTAPHFLFNTINNIDGILLGDPSKASEYLNELSTLLRFTLYESTEESILLSREIEYVVKYVDLQKIRSTNPRFVTLDIKGVPDTQRLAPMTFIPIVENAFKHVSTKTSDEAIQINIAISSNRVLFHCRNLRKMDIGVSTERGGLGTRILNDRLQLLYGDKHALKITTQDRYYDVELMIQL